MQEIKKDWIKIGLLDFQLKSHFCFNADILKKSGASRMIPYPYGGMFVRLSRTTKNYFHFINNSGYNIFPQVMIKADNVHSIFWWHDGNVGVLHYDSSISVVSTFGQVIKTYEPPERLTIACCKEFNFGIAFVNEKKNIYVFNSENEAFYQYGSLSQNAFPSLIDYSAKADKGVIVTESNEVFVFNGTDITRIWTAPSIPVQIKMHTSGKAIACINDSGLYIAQTAAAGTVNFQVQGIVDFAWLDENTVLIATPSQTIAIQLGFNSPITVPVENVYMFADDEDGLRIYANDVYTLTPIAKPLQQLLLPTNAHRVSLLVQAYQAYQSNNIACYAILDENSQLLQQTVEKIIAAAPFIMNVNVVEQLLTAAAFAKYQIHNFNHEEFADAIKRVRLLFSLRRPQEASEINRTGFSFLTTGSMYEHINKEHFVSFCANMRFFDLAEAIAKIEGKTDTSDIAMSWAMLTLSRDPRRVDVVLQRIEPYQKIDYKRLALFAKDCGSDTQNIVAIIKRIRDPVERIRMLTHPSYDQHVLSALHELKDGDAFIRYFFRTRFTAVTDRSKLSFLNSSPTILDQVIAFQRFINTALLEQVNVPPQRMFELTMIHTIPPDQFGRQAPHLEMLLKFFPKDKIIPWTEALKHQITIDEMLSAIPPGPQDVNGTGPAPSPRQIMERALVVENEKLFNKVAKEYSVDDRTIALTRLRTYMKYQQLNAKLAGLVQSVSTKMPLGAMADLLFEGKFDKLAIACIERIPKAEERLQKFVDKKLWKQAAEVAKSMKNPPIPYQELKERADREAAK